MIFLKNKETNEIIQTFDNVIDWGECYVEYSKNTARIKIYCGENEYFTNEAPVEEETLSEIDNEN